MEERRSPKPQVGSSKLSSLANQNDHQTWRRGRPEMQRIVYPPHGGSIPLGVASCKVSVFGCGGTQMVRAQAVTLSASGFDSHPSPPNTLKRETCRSGQTALFAKEMAPPGAPRFESSRFRQIFLRL